MRLLSATPSPFARKVRIALAEKRIPFELLTSNPWGTDSQAARLNPLAKIPVLLLDDGRTIFDSRNIVEYLEAIHPAPALLPVGIEDSFLAKRFEVIADGVCDAIVLIVLERARLPQLCSETWIGRQRAKVDAGIAAIAEGVAGPWCLRCGFGLADIAVGAMFGYLDLRLPELDWRAPYPILAKLMERLMTRASFQSTVPTPQKIDLEATG